VSIRNPLGRAWRDFAWKLAAVAAAIVTASAQSRDPHPIDLTQANLEDLMNLRVTSVSKRSQSLSRTAAAVFVITQEDIRRSGATNIPDVLRMAPGVDVQQIDANAWAISVRGFNSRYSNKVLVLIDGRAVYTPSFSGVYWEHLDLPLEDIERIEVIRGPGASIWGANAVNGVISIFTKSSRETQGGLASAGAGSQTEALGELQYGGTLGSAGAYRVYGKHTRTRNSAAPEGSEANDRWSTTHGGFRSDWDLGSRDALLVEGDTFFNDQNQTRRTNLVDAPYNPTFPENFTAQGGNLLARWTHTLEGGSETTLQAYFDGYRRSDLGVPEVLRTFDIDFQHHVATGGRHDFMWGAGYRVYRSALAPGYVMSFSPPSRTDALYSGFVQDEIRLADSWWLALGVKLEHNPYTGFQGEPSARLVWAPASGRQTFWTAASRALRQPARIDTAIRVPVLTVPLGPDLVQVAEFTGNPEIGSEALDDYEAGYRAEISRSLSLDIATFLSFYRHLESSQPMPEMIVPGQPVQVLTPLLCRNGGRAVDYGGEVFLNWTASPRWRISPVYSYLHSTIRLDEASRGLMGMDVSVGFPQNMFQLRSLINLTRRTEFDQSLYYMARLPGSSLAGHARLDLRLARKIGERAEVSVVGQNLLRPRTQEYGDSLGIAATRVKRSVYGSITWRF
jgi:iron complex outermembrane receptor protein